MNSFFQQYVETAKAIASDHGISWHLSYDEQGRVDTETRWNLSTLVGLSQPPYIWLGRVGVEPNSFAALNENRRAMGAATIPPTAMTAVWIDLFKAVLIHQLLLKNNKPMSAMKMAVPVRQLAAVAGIIPPWLITGIQVREAYNSVLSSSSSGKVALDFKMMIAQILDRQHLCDIPSLARFCTPFASSDAKRAQQTADELRSRQNGSGSLRGSLTDRKSAEKLPNKDAFWELVRIVFTEPPRSFNDFIRFSVAALLIIMGFRIGETIRLPLDWAIWKEFFDVHGRSAEASGGIARALRMRYFAEKQKTDSADGGQGLYENAVEVPRLFEQLVVELLDKVARTTYPLRERLKRQTETGRIFPEYDEDQLIPAWEMYVRVTGNAKLSSKPIPEELLSKYRLTLDPALLLEIREDQLRGDLRNVVVYWLRPEMKSITVRMSDGKPFPGKIGWKTAFFRVGDVERYMHLNTPTKISNVAPMSTLDGSLVYPHQMLFLSPIRNLAEGRNGSVLDITLYSAVGSLGSQEMMAFFSGSATTPSVFRRYGKNEADRALTMVSHSSRHLQTSELFRLGVADTMLSKKFGRKSVAQNYDYDHRSLVEDLKSIDVPEDVEERLGENATQVFKLIKANRVRGPIVDEFQQVQRRHGDAAAFDYLRAEADGLHATPYGLCLNSFLSDPCPKHLQCFAGCIHLARTHVVEERRSLETMRDRFLKIIEDIDAIPEPRRTAGWANQLAHAHATLNGISTALSTAPGVRVFPEGRDLSLTAEQKYNSTILDNVQYLRDLDV